MAHPGAFLNMRHLQERIQHKTSVRMPSSIGDNGTSKATCNCSWSDSAQVSKFSLTSTSTKRNKAFQTMLESAEKHWWGVRA